MRFIENNRVYRWFKNPSWQDISSPLLICQVPRQTHFIDRDHVKIWWVVVGTWYYNWNGSGWLLNAIRESVECVCVCVCVCNSALFWLCLVNNVTRFTGCFHPELFFFFFFFFTTMHNYCVRIWCQISDFQWTIRAVWVHLLPAASDQQPLSHHVCRALKLSIPSVRQHVTKTWLLCLISQLCEVRFKVSHKNKILRWRGCRKRLSVVIFPFVPPSDTFITVLWNK